MLWALTALLAFQLAGEALVAWLQLPAPGPVVGMALLFIALIIRGGAPKAWLKPAVACSTTYH